MNFSHTNMVIGFIQRTHIELQCIIISIIKIFVFVGEKDHFYGYNMYSKSGKQTRERILCILFGFDIKKDVFKCMFQKER